MSKNTLFLSIKIFFLIIIIFFFFRFIDHDDLLSQIHLISKIDILIIILFYLIYLFLICTRWFLVVKNFTKFKFFYFFKNITLGFNLVVISSSALALDGTKIIGIKNELGYKKSILLVLYDKIFTLLFKISFLLIIFNTLNYFKFNYYFEEFIIISFFVFLFLILFISKINYFINLILKFKNIQFLNDIDNILKKNNNRILSLFFINLIMQLLMVAIYIKALNTFNINFSLLDVFLFTPLIEVISQFQVLLIGIKEAFTVYIYSLLNLPRESVLMAAILIKLAEFICGFTFYLLTLINNKPQITKIR